MRPWRSLALWLPLALLPTTAAAQAPDARPDPAANAALKYWQAFAQMPTLDKDQETLLGDWGKAPLDDAALKLIAASEKARVYLHRGVKLPRCDWGLDFDDGPGLLLPHLAKARDLARLTALHARHEFAQRHWEAGVDDALAILTLARHVGADPTMISILVRYAIETIAIDLLAAHLPDLRKQFPRIVAAYEALPPGATYRQAYGAEKKYMVQWMSDRLKEAESRKKGSWRIVWRGVLDGSAVAELANDMTLDEAVRLTEGLLPLCDQLATLVTLPRDEFEAQYPEFKKKAKAGNRLTGAFLSAADKLLATQYRNEAQVALLKAAMAVVEGGPDRLKDVKDPFGDGPFGYRALDKGFELKSKLLHQDQPVTLTVGQGKKG